MSQFNRSFSSKFKTSNLLDNIAWIASEYVNQYTGATSANASFTRTDYVSVDPAKGYLDIRGFNQGSVGCFFTAGHAYISAITNNGIIAIPPTAAYVMCSFATANNSASACLIRHVNIGGLWTDKTYSERLAYNPYRGAWSGFIGDSLTKADGIAYPYHTIVKDLLEIGRANNYGLNGTSISATGNANDAFCSTSRLATWREGLDLIVVHGGTNDYALNVPIGTIADTTDISFYGALHVLCQALIGRYLGKKIVFITPIHRQTETANSAGHTLTDYRTAIIAVCQLYGIPVIDGFTLGISNIAVSITAFFSDTVHLKQEGHRLFGVNLASQLLKV